MCIRFFDYLTKPFLVVKKKKAAFTLWVTSTIIAGNFGLVFNMFIRKYMNSISAGESLIMDFTSGSLFLFSIVLLASSFGSVLIDFVSKEDKDFKQPKTIWCIIAVLVWGICGVVYACFMSAQLDPINKDVSHDVWQWVFFVISIFLSIYAYCLVIMDANDSDFFTISDNYDKKEEQNIKKLEKKQEDLINDGKEVKL